MKARAESAKAHALHKVWYEFPGPRGSVHQFATWNEGLGEFSVDFSSVWKTVVLPELHARGAYSQWRIRPCKRFGSVLPSGVSCWSDFLRQGGIRDPTTGLGSLSEKDKTRFWNDQCSCDPPCWIVETLCVDSDRSLDSAKPSACACKEHPCVCNTDVQRSWTDELDRLRTMRKLLPFGRQALDARIAEIQTFVKQGKANPHPIKLRDLLRLDQASQVEAERLRFQEIEHAEHARKCSSFWWSLEDQFLAHEKREPKSAVELLQWFWKGKEDFVAAYRKRMGRHVLSYLET